VPSITPLRVVRDTGGVAGREAGMELIDGLKLLARRNAYGYVGGAGLLATPTAAGAVVSDARRRPAAAVGGGPGGARIEPSGRHASPGSCRGESLPVHDDPVFSVE
jgi:hypothetical protein